VEPVYTLLLEKYPPLTLPELAVLSFAKWKMVTKALAKTGRRIFC
jgi:hypothetical protein